MAVDLSQVTIRPACAADAPALSTFLARTFAETFGWCTPADDMAAYLAEKFTPDRQLAEINDTTGGIFVADAPAADGSIALVGCVYVFESTPPDCIRGLRPIELKRLYVDTAWHGGGLAQALMTEAFRQARARGGRTMWLTVYEHNDRAKSFYRRYGFEPKGQTVFPVGSDPQIDWLMERSLDVRPTIRFATARDGAALSAIYAPAIRESYVSFEFEPPDAAEMAERVTNSTRTPWLVCDVDGEVVGYAYAGTYRQRPAYQWSVEVSAYVRGDQHRRGVARALYASLFALLELQQFHTAYAGITLPNDPSVGLHQAVGFTLVGVFHDAGYKHGAWRDVAFFERPIGTHPADPPSPLPLVDVRNDPSYIDRIDQALREGLTHLRYG